MVFGSIELPLPFDILDAAVMEWLPGYVRYGWLEFTREQITPASVAYRLRHDELGELGHIKLRKVSEKSSEISIGLPPRPRGRSPTPEELEDIGTIPGPEERLGAHAALSKKIRAESTKLYLRRKEHQERVIKAMFDRMAHDSAFQEARGQLEAAPERMAEQRKKPQVYVPTRPKDLLRWRAVWSSPSFRMGLKTGATYETLRKRIENLKYKLPSSSDTIRKIIRAGMAGLLEPIDFEQLDRLGLKRKH